ncbi:MAG: tetratricopeptide repeat protein [Raineya sp.]|nr:tetratricopeptide repeat protein [Raineya sp.]MDW8296377.1 tetratricopeptide repeat protein [Raineya sp.]
MLKWQGFLVVGAVCLVIGFFFLPKVVVKNPSGKTVEQAVLEKDKTTSSKQHDPEITESDLKIFAYFKKEWQTASDVKTKLQWTDSLAKIYKKFNQWDSAAFYAEKVAQQYNEKLTWLKTAESYFEAFTFALDSSKIRQLGQKSLQAYEKVLSFEPENLLAQTKMGVLYKNLNPQAPMKGIQMVAAVVKKDPNNELALFYLGTFYAERGAFQEAIERFEKVVKLNPKNPDAWIYLAQCYEETQKPQKAKEALQKVLDLDIAPEIKQEIQKKIQTL